MRTLLISTLGAALLFPALAFAAEPANQEGLPKGAEQNPAAADVTIDTTIPENPGFAIIALTPTNVIDPSAMRISSINVSDFIDDDGKAKTGLAFAGSPYFWLNPHERLSVYQAKVQRDWLTRAISLTTFSVGYVRKQDGKPERLGVGFATELLGKTTGPNGEDVYADYRLDHALSNCIGDAYVKYVKPDPAKWEKAARDELALARSPTPSPLPELTSANPANPFTPGTSAWDRYWLQARQDDLANAAFAKIKATEPPAEMKAATKLCRSQALERHANRQSLVLAGGVALLPNPRPGENSTDGGSVWASYRRPLGILPENYLTLFARHDFDRQAEIPGGFQGFEKTSAAALLGYERKLPEDVERGLARVSFQAGYERLNYHGVGPLKDDESSYYALTVDYRILKNTYLEVKGGQGSLEIGGKGKADKITFSVRHSLQ